MDDPTNVVDIDFRSGRKSQLPNSPTTESIRSIIRSRLFAPKKWLLDKEYNLALLARYEQLGVTETVPGEIGTVRLTDLGQEINFDLLSAMAGTFDEWDLLGILFENGLLDAADVDSLRARLEAGEDPETVLLPVVRKAYCDYFGEVVGGV
jgi:hypothetical protein